VGYVFETELSALRVCSPVFLIPQLSRRLPPGITGHAVVDFVALVARDGVDRLRAMGWSRCSAQGFEEVLFRDCEKRKERLVANCALHVNKYVPEWRFRYDRVLGYRGGDDAGVLYGQA